MVDPRWPRGAVGGPAGGGGALGPVAAAAGYAVLAIALSWLPWLAVLMTTGDPAGSPWATALWVLGGLGPAGAAVVMSSVDDRARGVRRLVAGLLRWRVGRWYLLLLAPAPVAAGAVLLAVATGDAGLEPAGLGQWYLLPGLFASALVLGGLEEIGWRGYLLPRLQGRCSALAASLVVGGVWSAWHTPLFLMETTSQAGAPTVPFTVQAFALSIVLAWIYNSTGGSVLLVVLVHAAVNAWYSAAVQGLAPEAVGAFTPFAALLVAVAALVLVRRYGGRDLSRRPRHTL